MRHETFWIATLLVAGCAGAGYPDIVDARDLSTAFGAPRISRIRDAGGGRLPTAGPWKGDGDGIAVPGELVVIEGDNFGRLPTVSIGGRATTIVARTDGGGIVARVPAGVPVGDVPIVVSQPKGRAQKSFPVRRYGVVAHGGLLYFLRVDAKEAQPIDKPLAVAGARLVRISSDGGAAYVIASRADGDHLVAVDLCAAGAPRLASDKKLAHHGALLTAAMDAPVAAVVGDGEITIVQTRDPRAPALYEPMDLPMGAKAPRAVELSPDGKLLAVLVGDGNRLVALDVAQPPSSSVVTAVDLLPDQKVALVRDLAFSSDGETLWVVSGDGKESLPAVQPTRLTAVRILPKAENAPAATEPKQPAKKDERLVSVWRTQSLPGAAAPIHVAVARGQPVASGTTIRMPPEKAAVFVSSISDGLFKLGDLAVDTAPGAKAAQKLWHPAKPAIMVRGDINGGGGPLFTTAEIDSSLDLTPDAQLLVATAARLSPVPSTGSVLIDFGITYAAIWGTTITPVFLPLARLAPSELKPPFHFGDIRIQP